MSVSKRVLISIQPKWCDYIMDGLKSYELRKTRPKIDGPFKCYIYCTKAKTKDDLLWDKGHTFIASLDDGRYDTGTNYDVYNGKVIGEFTCDYIYEVTCSRNAFDDEIDIYCTEDNLVTESCVGAEEMYAYFGEYVTGYAWHIKDFKLYDHGTPIEYFRSKPCESLVCQTCTNSWIKDIYRADKFECGVRIKRPPQSWCYCYTP